MGLGKTLQVISLVMRNSGKETCSVTDKRAVRVVPEGVDMPALEKDDGMKHDCVRVCVCVCACVCVRALDRRRGLRLHFILCTELDEESYHTESSESEEEPVDDEDDDDDMGAAGESKKSSKKEKAGSDQDEEEDNPFALSMDLPPIELK